MVIGDVFELRTEVGLADLVGDLHEGFHEVVVLIDISDAVAHLPDALVVFLELVLEGINDLRAAVDIGLTDLAEGRAEILRGVLLFLEQVSGLVFGGGCVVKVHLGELLADLVGGLIEVGCGLAKRLDPLFRFDLFRVAATGGTEGGHRQCRQEQHQP